MTSVGRSPGHRQRRVWRRLATAGAAVLVAAACGGAPTSAEPAAPGAVSGLDLLLLEGPERQAALEGAARAEGAVTIYVSSRGGTIDLIAQAFEERYPFIDVTTFPTGANDIITKVEEETAAGRPTADVIETTRESTRIFEEAGMLAPYWSEHILDLPADMVRRDADGNVLFVVNRVGYLGICYNTDLVAAADRPQSWEDLADPGLAPRMAVASSANTGPRWVATMIRDLGESAAVALMERMRDAGVKREVGSPSVVAGLIAQGNYGVLATCFEDHITQLANDGSHVEWGAVGTAATANYGGVSIQASTPHPAASALLADFIHSPEGRAIYDEQGYHDPRTELAFELYDPTEDFATLDEYAQAHEGWNELFTRIFG